MPENTPVEINTKSGGADVPAVKKGLIDKKENKEAVKSKGRKEGGKA